MNRPAKFKINQKVKFLDLVGTIIDYKTEIIGGFEFNLYLVKYEDINIICYAFEESLKEC